MGALVQHLMQSLSTVRLRDADAVVFLIAVIVVGQFLPELCVDLLHGHGYDLFRGENLLHCGIQWHLPLASEVPEGRIQVVAVMYHRHHRHLVHLNQFTQRAGQKCGSAAGRIACLGIHGQNIAPLQHLADGFDQMNIRGKLPGGNGADPLQQEEFVHVAVDAHYVADRVGMGCGGRQLKVDKVHMVAQQHVRGLQSLHIDLFHLIFLTDQRDPGQRPDEPCPEFRLMHGVSWGVSFLIFVVDLDVHTFTSSQLYMIFEKKARTIRFRH